MKTVLKKITAAVVIACILLTSSLPAFALAENVETESTDKVPYIHIAGLMTSDIYSDQSDRESDTVWPPATGNIVKGVLKLLPAIAARELTGNYEKYSDRLCDALLTVLEPAFLDSNGEVMNSTGAGFVYPSKEEILNSDKIWFDYDWRIDPFIVAEELDSFIDYVLACTGSDKVILESHSYGGIIITTYAGEYGTSKLQSVLYNASAACGETFTGDLCQGKLKLDAEGLTEYLKGAFAHEDGEKFWDGFFAFLYKSGLTGFICKKVNKVVDRCHDDIFRKVVYPMFGNWPSIWTMVTDEMYEESVNAVFEDFYKNDGIDHSEMKAKIDRYTAKIRNNREAILNDINDNCNLYIVCRYGYCSMFCTPSWRIANDMICDVHCASFGATAANYGEKLSEEYLGSVDRKYISPDCIIDASTCMFPQQTWFIYDYMHMKSYPDNMFEKLVYSPAQATVDSFEEYPQYLNYVGNGTVVPAN